ncbi:MAG: helix-turn-helix domain-containing protein [Nanoarchaeota archaeon]
MSLRQTVIGVNHQDCWGSLSTIPFEDISMVEAGPVIMKDERGAFTISTDWKVSYPNKQRFKEFYDSLKKFRMIKQKRIVYAQDTEALIKTTWRNKDSSYDKVLKNDCLFHSPVTQKDGYEIYTTLSEKPKEVRRLMNELEEIGEIKIFKIKKMADQNQYVLSPKQLQALQAALTYNYYHWPRQVTLNDLSKKLNTTRRAYQENLRKAEMKVFPHMIRNVLDKNIYPQDAINHNP